MASFFPNQAQILASQTGAPPGYTWLGQANPGGQLQNVYKGPDGKLYVAGDMGQGLKPSPYSPQVLQAAMQGLATSRSQDQAAQMGTLGVGKGGDILAALAGGAIGANALGMFGGAPTNLGIAGGTASFDPVAATAADVGTAAPGAVAGGSAAVSPGAFDTGAFEGIGNTTGGIVNPEAIESTTGATTVAAGGGGSAGAPVVEQSFNAGGPLTQLGSAGSGTSAGLLSGLFGSGGGVGSNLLGSAVGAGFNFLSGSFLQNQAINAAKQLQQTGNPLNDPQRQQYQTQLANLLNNPTSFWQTNPVAVGQLDLAKNMFEANTAKMGTGGTQFSDYLKNVTDAASGTFNSQAQLLAGLGGFNLPAQGTNAAGQLQQTGLLFGNAGQTLAGQSIANLFKSPTNTQNITSQPTQTPTQNTNSTPNQTFFDVAAG